MSEGVYRSRLTKAFEEKAASFVSSLSEDSWILLEDLDGTEAHDIMLAEQGVISKGDLKAILGVLEEIREKASKGEL
ncbi:MAG: hypothetical protein QW390_04525, partial [Candidatus Bathyarchaeia archaeon]